MEDYFLTFFSTHQDDEPQREWYTIFYRERPVTLILEQKLRVSPDGGWYTIRLGVQHPGW